MDRIWSGFTLTLVLLIAIGTAIGLGLARMGVVQSRTGPGVTVIIR